MIAENTGLFRVREDVHLRAKTKRDFKIAARRLIMNNDGRIVFPYQGEHRPLEMTDWSAGQLFSKLQMPSQYFKRLLHGNPDSKALVSDHVNFNLHQDENTKDNEVWFIRTYGSNTARAFLSDRYSKLDDDFLVDSLNALIKHDNNIQMYYTDDRSLHLRITFPDLNVVMGKLRGGNVNDEVQVGIHVANSEVGSHALTVESVLYRKVCSNGLIIPVKEVSLQQRHVHLNEREIQGRLRDAITNCIQEGHTAIDNFAATKEVPIIEPIDIIDELAKNQKYSEKFTDTIKSSYALEKSRSGDTQFTLLNALTDAAKTLNTSERVDVEKFAGKLMNNRKFFER